VHAAASPAARLSAPVGTDGWTEELGARLTWMTHQGVQSATLQLSPEHLGPLQVSISVQHGEASVWFGAAHPDTRQALEQAMPQLRQMLSGQGLTLTDSGVSRDPPREQAPRKASEPPAGAGAEASSAALSGPSRAPLGMVDAYA
jgi:flagellar hook-length control protein FliK